MFGYRKTKIELNASAFWNQKK